MATLRNKGLNLPRVRLSDDQVEVRQLEDGIGTEDEPCRPMLARDASHSCAALGIVAVT
jgi:hypothetical protein